MTKVTLHGLLGQEVGDTWNLLVHSAAEALRAIEANTGKLYNFLKKSPAAEYRVIINGVDVTDATELQLPSQKLHQIDIIPIPSGAGGLWQTILGVVLIIVAIVLIATGVGAPGGAGILGLSAGMTGFLASTALTIGISLTLGGIAQMMAKTPQLNPGLPGARGFADKTNPTLNADGQDTSKSRPSYLFSGTVNTISQGNCVPLGYGRMRTGSQLISFGLFTAPLPSDVAFGDAVRGSTTYDFEYDAVWAILEGSDIIVPYRSISDMTKVPIPQTQFAFFKFGLINAHFPKFPGGTSTMRNYLDTVYYIFRGPRLSQITKQRAWQLALRLWLNAGGATLPVDTGAGIVWKTYKQITLQEAIMVCADYYADFVTP